MPETSRPKKKAAAKASPARKASARKPARARASAAPAAVAAGVVEPLEPKSRGPSAPVSAARREARAGRPVGATITILQYVSGIGCPVRHKATLRALGLRHPHHTVVRPDNPAVRGMVKSIQHLVRIVESGHGA